MSRKSKIFIFVIFLGLFLLLFKTSYTGSLEDLRRKLKMNENRGQTTTEMKMKSKIGITEISEGVIYVPPKYDPKKPMPVILLLTWHTGKPMEIVNIWMAYADLRNYILVAPRSSGDGWNKTEKAKIMRFLNAAMKNYNIDRKNIMIFGHSNGAQMALKVGLKYQKYFKAIGLSACNFDKAMRSYGTPLYSRDKKDQPGIYIIQGAEDETTPPVYGRKTRDKLLKYNYNVTYNEIHGLGHDIPYDKIDTIIDWFESFQYRE